MNALLALGAILFAFGVTEMAVRLVWPQATAVTHQDRYGLAMHYPGITRFLPQYGHEVTFNSVGMRDREHTEQKPAGVFRILLLGDSFTEALQVPFEASLPSLIEGALAQRTGKRIEVINAGVGGWGTDDELRYLTSYGLRYHPDLVVVAMTLHNDISDNLRQDWHRVEGGVLMDQPRSPMSVLDWELTQVKAYAATRFQTYQLWRRVRHGSEIRQAGQQLRSHVVQLFEAQTPPRIAEGVTLTDLELQRIQAVTQGAGGRVVLVLLPIRYQLSDSSFADFVRGAQMSPAAMQIEKPQQMITPLAESLGIPVIDLLPRFREWTAEGAAPLYLNWDGHWTEAGHRLAAEVVTDGLLRVGVVK